MPIKSARARSVMRYSAMATGGNSLPGSGQNLLGSVGRERVAIGMLQHLLIAAHLLVTGEGGPSGKLGFRRGGGRHDAGRFVSRLRHAVNIARMGHKQKGPGFAGAFDISKP